MAKIRLTPKEWFDKNKNNSLEEIEKYSDEINELIMLGVKVNNIGKYFKTNGINISDFKLKKYIDSNLNISSKIINNNKYNLISISNENIINIISNFNEIYKDDYDKFILDLGSNIKTMIYNNSFVNDIKYDDDYSLYFNFIKDNKKLNNIEYSKEILIDIFSNLYLMFHLFYSKELFSIFINLNDDIPNYLKNIKEDTSKEDLNLYVNNAHEQIEKNIKYLFDYLCSNEIKDDKKFLKDSIEIYKSYIKKITYKD